MAVRRLTKNPETGEFEASEPEHIGLVVEIECDYNVRKMSDIWADDFYAIIWTGAGTMRIFLHSNFDLQPPQAEAEVDAPQEVMEAFQAWKVAKEEAQRDVDRKIRARIREEQARDAAREPKIGFPARVVKGRKVPVGTEGLVFWMGDGSYGARVGIRDADGNAHWTAASNVERIVNKPEGQTWVEFSYEENLRIPVKGLPAEILNGPDKGKIGLVFWMKDARLGITLSTRKDSDGRYVDVIWSTIADSRRVEDDDFILPDPPSTSHDEVEVEVEVEVPEDQVIVPF